MIADGMGFERPFHWLLASWRRECGLVQDAGPIDSYVF